MEQTAAGGYSIGSRSLGQVRLDRSSVPAAKSIIRKFLLLFTEPDEEGNPPEDFHPTPQNVLNKTVEELRSAGLSGRKAEYIQDLSKRFDDGRLNTTDMINDTDEQIIEKLVQVKGIGQWSFALLRLWADSRR